MDRVTLPFQRGLLDSMMRSDTRANASARVVIPGGQPLQHAGVDVWGSFAVRAYVAAITSTS
jgi:hypothetical protein